METFAVESAAGPVCVLTGDLTEDLDGDRAYLYGDGTLTGTRAATPKLFQADLGAAVRPFATAPGWEVRAGARARYDLGSSDLEREVYVSIRFVY